MKERSDNRATDSNFLLKEKSYRDLLTNLSVLSHTIVSLVHDYCVTEETYDSQTLSIAKMHLAAAQELLFSCLERNL